MCRRWPCGWRPFLILARHPIFTSLNFEITFLRPSWTFSIVNLKAVEWSHRQRSAAWLNPSLRPEFQITSIIVFVMHGMCVRVRAQWSWPICQAKWIIINIHFYFHRLIPITCAQHTSWKWIAFWKQERRPGPGISVSGRRGPAARENKSFNWITGMNLNWDTLGTCKCIWRANLTLCSTRIYQGC